MTPVSPCSLLPLPYEVVEKQIGNPGGANSPRARTRGSTSAGDVGAPWLVLVYRVPSEPTRLRAAVWRRLKALGAIYLQNSVAAMPSTVGGARAFRALRNEIVEEMGGTALLLASEALVGEADIVASFNAARDEEYQEIVDRCQAFLDRIEKETAEKRFTYVELEENDEDLTKLRRWFDKVRGRDVLGSDGARHAEDALTECTQALNGFADRVYEVDTATNSVLRGRR